MSDRKHNISNHKWRAADKRTITPVQNTEEEDTSIIVEERDNEDFIVKEQNGKYENTGFVNLSSDYLYVRSSTSDDSDWTGKLYPGNVVTLEGPVGEWTAIRSGNVTGFVRSENLMEMKSAQQKIRQMEAEALKNGTEVTFSYGETKEEEASRLQAEAEQRAREEAERKQAQRQAVVDYACQFIGNPYVWGGRASQTERTVPDLRCGSLSILEFPPDVLREIRHRTESRSPCLRSSRVTFCSMRAERRSTTLRSISAMERSFTPARQRPVLLFPTRITERRRRRLRS